MYYSPASEEEKYKIDNRIRSKTIKCITFIVSLLIIAYLIHLAFKNSNAVVDVAILLRCSLAILVVMVIIAIFISLSRSTNMFEVLFDINLIEFLLEFLGGLSR